MIDLFSHPLWMHLGLTLAHFVWQGAAVALLLGMVLLLLRHRSPHARYVASTGALLLMLACPLVTVWYVSTTQPVAGVPVRPPSDIPIAEQGHRADPVDLAVSDVETSVAQEQGRAGHPIQPAGAWIESGGISDHDRTDAGHVVLELGIGHETEATSGLSPSESGSGRAEPAPLAASSGSPSDPVAAGSDPVPWWQDRDARQRMLGTGLPVAAAVWCFGVALLALRLMGGWLALRRWRHGASPALPDHAVTAVGRITEQLALPRRVEVRVSERSGHPLAFGLLRPVVLLPASAATHLPPDLLEAMIAHELAHIRRHDLWVNLFQRVAETLLFYHPAVWWVSGRMRLERELCCDDLAVSVTGRRVEYAEALVALARQSQPAAAPALSAGMFGDRATLTRRVRRILGLPEPQERLRAWPAGPITLALVAVVVLIVAIPPALSVDVDERDAGRAEAVKDEAGLDDPSGEGEAPEVDTQPLFAALSATLPATGAIETHVDPDTAKQLQDEIDRIRPALEALDTFYRVHQLAYLARFPAMGDALDPVEDLTTLDLRQLRTDLQALGLDRSPHNQFVWGSAWSVHEVAVSPQHNSALIRCRPSNLTINNLAWGMQFSILLSRDPDVPDAPFQMRRVLLEPYEGDKAIRTTRRGVVREHMLDPEGGEGAIESFLQAWPAGDDGSRSYYSMRFHGDGHPTRWRDVSVSRDGSIQITAEHAFESSIGRVPWFRAVPAALAERSSERREPRPRQGGRGERTLEDTRTGPPAPKAPDPGDDRTFTFEWRNVPFSKVVEAFEAMTETAIIGMDLLPRDLAARTITLVSTHPMSLDEALLSLNRVIFDLNLWIIRRDHLHIRELPAWYRQIPAAHLFHSEEAYREADLPLWEIASVPYRPKGAPAETLARGAADWVPLDASRAKVSEDGHAIRLTGFVQFLNEQLEILARLDVPTTQPAGRTALRTIEPGDWLQIRALDYLARDEWTDLSQTVDEAGNVYMPPIGKLRAEGLTPSQFRDRIIAEAKDARIYLEDHAPFVFVEFQSAAPTVSRPATPRPGSGMLTRPPTTQPVDVAADTGHTVPVRSLVDGIIAEVKVRPGQKVKQGELLVKLDGDLVTRELEAAMGRMRMLSTHAEHFRALPEGLVSRLELLAAATEAELAELEVRRWDLRLERTRITSPVDGVVAEMPEERVHALIGQRVTAGDVILHIAAELAPDDMDMGETDEEQPAGPPAAIGGPEQSIETRYVQATQAQFMVEEWLKARRDELTEKERQVAQGELEVELMRRALAEIVEESASASATHQDESESDAAGVPAGRNDARADEIEWREYSRERVLEEVNAGHTVFVEYTADWCAFCKKMRHTVIDTPEVREPMQRLGVRPFIADFTSFDPEIKRDLDHYGRAGVPMYLIVPADDPERVIAMDSLTKDSLVAALEQAGASR